MPSFVRFIAGTFLVLPGIAMWLAGTALLLCYSTTLPRTILHTADGRYNLLVYLIFAGLSVALMAFGHAMIAAFDLLTAKRRYDIPGKKVLHCIGMELLVQILAVIGFAVAVSSLLVFWDLQKTSPWSAALLFLAGFGGCAAAILLHKRNLVLRQRWKAAHAASLPVGLPEE
jgi:hypothetical protein